MSRTLDEIIRDLERLKSSALTAHEVHEWLRSLANELETKAYEVWPL